MEDPVTLTSFADFDRVFGGLWAGRALGYAVQDFYRHGGSVAVVVRAYQPRDDDTAVLALRDDSGPQLILRAASPGTWGTKLLARTDADARLMVCDSATGQTESFADISLVDSESTLVRVDTWPERLPPSQTATLRPALHDGDSVDAAAYRRALGALRRAGVVNLLVVPGVLEAEVVARAVSFAEERPALLLADPPAAWSTVDDAVAGATSAAFPGGPNAAVYFPRIREPGPLRGASGAVAGVMARTDMTRGVWTAPAGVEAELDGVLELDIALGDMDAGRLSSLGVNPLRSLPGTGPVIWGARIADREWKYVQVRRTAFLVEESIDRGTRWAAFEPNDEQLWERIRGEIGEFMEDLFRRGAFAGTTPRDAYVVRCDRETTTQEDIDRGVVNVVVGFAPLKPAEFVFVRLQRAAGRRLVP